MKKGNAKKLSLNKVKVSKLTDTDLKHVKGGIISFPSCITAVAIFCALTDTIFDGGDQ